MKLSYVLLVLFVQTITSGPGITPLMLHIRPKRESIISLIRLAKRMSKSTIHETKLIKDSIVLTGGSFGYRVALLNWIESVHKRGIRNYIVLCFDELTYNLVGSRHGVLITNSLNYSINSLPMISNQTEAAYNNNSNRIGIPKGNRKLFVPPGAEFLVMMVAKFDAIASILRLGKAVVWADSDCILLRQCSVSVFESMLHTKATNTANISLGLVNHHRIVDIVAQQGLTPTLLSEHTGACICTGYFMVNPTAPSLFLIESTRDELIRSVFIPKSKNCDQTLLNMIAFGMGGFDPINASAAAAFGGAKVFHFGSGGPETIQYSGRVDFSRTLKLSEVRREHGHWIYRAAAGKLFVDAVVAVPRTRRVRMLTVALLPYKDFPRGRPMQSMDGLGQGYGHVLVDARIEGNTSDFAAAYENTTRSNMLSPSEIDVYAEEWRKYSAGACIWHMLTPKTGGLKEQAMRRDGVYTFSHDAAAAAEAAVPQSHERSSTQRALLWNQSESAARC